MEPGNLIVQARAKIIWGEPGRSVRQFLISNGMADAEADIMVRELCAKRYAELRWRGFGKALLGVGLLIASILLMFLCLWHVDWEKMDALEAHVQARTRYGFAVVGGVGVLYGISRIIDGVVSILRAKSNQQSLSDMQV